MGAGVDLRALLILLVVFTAFLPSSKLEKDVGSEVEVVVTILSQGDTCHSERAKDKRQQWLEQLRESSSSRGDHHETNILLAHELHLKGAVWTVAPLLPYLSEHHPSAGWYLFTSEETQVNFGALWDVLERFDATKEWFLGHALRDQGRTIIHHYMDHTSNESISYPNFASGWLLSWPALERAAKRADKFSPNFNIDAQFELAMFLKYLRTPSIPELFPSIPSAGDSGGYLITHVPELCMERQLTRNCVTAYSHDLPDCGTTGLDRIFIGVKTCKKFHSTRLPVLQGTWAADAGSSIAYYSEEEDTQFSTTDIGVPNTEKGHCGKMMAIIGRFWSSDELRERDWLIIADDDTLLSVPRLRRLLACYSPDQPILLGEVYGYSAHSYAGYSYVTGGGSMVLSRTAVEVIMQRGVVCPDDSTADDMFLGKVAEKLAIDIVHSPLFHQAQPDTFHSDVLALQTAVSFHRHQPNDPYTVYSKYLTDTGPHEDTSEQPTPTNRASGKTEL